MKESVEEEEQREADLPQDELGVVKELMEYEVKIYYM